jgi:hypothetical protein
VDRRDWESVLRAAIEISCSPPGYSSLIRMSGGNFRLLTRLLTQIERILKVNNLDTVSKDIVAAARDSLVIGQV